MEIIGQKVEHHVFGAGVVTDKRDGFLTVQFPNCKKSFLYPDAFSQFLVLQNSDLQGEMQGALKKREEAQQAREREEQAQWRKEANLRTMRISSRAQAVFDIPEEQLDDVFSQWQVSTGTYTSGYSKGEPRVPDRMKPNSMCIITTVPQGEPESQRRIAGLFMAEDTLEGDQCLDGVLHAHPQYRLRLEPGQERLFWPYITREKARQKWGSTSLKYLANTVGRDILRDLRGEKSTGKDFLSRFYRYYCSLNRLEDQK